MQCIGRLFSASNGGDRFNRGQIPIKLASLSVNSNMARQPRLTVAAYPHHVIQRGNDRQPIVRDDADRERLLALWQEHAQAAQRIGRIVQSLGPASAV